MHVAAAAGRTDVVMKLMEWGMNPRHVLVKLPDTQIADIERLVFNKGGKGAFLAKL